ncbi:MAG: hypothetical protein O2854_06725, partial [Chloroflexi bacterium]|nr:hypothetical protein [Chloroflexota bacterium]
MAVVRNKPSKVAQTLSSLGHCMELVSIDPHCFDITVGLYEKDGILTLHSFSQRPEVLLRLGQIRGQLIKLGGLVPVPRITTKANFPCGYIHARPLKFLIMQAVEKPPDYVIPDEPIKDLRSELMLSATPKEVDGRWVYEISATGEYNNVDGRV